ncbi:MAG: outer membrane protein assembly factor BamC [Betaproteobacteria bacterium]|nr:outer membrane protein assembly factor BamC [Betaproteobacteria bacterium]
MRPLKLTVWTALLGAAVVAGCSALPKIESQKIDYKSAGKLPPLEVPPDLTRPTGDDRYAVPDVSSQGTATYSAYAKERAAQPQTGTNSVLPTQDNARIERAGTQRWLVVKGAPERLWPLVKEFWQEIGFIVNVESPEAGVMETDWAENRAKIPDGAIRGFLSKVFDSIYSTSERDKFRTRLESGAEPGTTEIYVSHRGMIEVYISEGQKDTRWQPRPPDPDLEAEMLRRLMVRFGVQEARAKAQLASAPQSAPRATLIKGQSGAGVLSLADQFDRAWRRVGLALDRVGFTVEDRDRSKGIYFVRYVDPETDDKTSQKGGFLSKLWPFGRSDNKQRNPQYRIQVQNAESGSQVNVLNKDGVQEASETATRILSLLYEQLK